MNVETRADAPGKGPVRVSATTSGQRMCRLVPGALTATGARSPQLERPSHPRSAVTPAPTG